MGRKRYYRFYIAGQGASSSCNMAGCAAQIYRTFPDGSRELLQTVEEPLGRTLQAAAEYIGLIHAIRSLLRQFKRDKLAVRHSFVRILGDSMLVLNQLQGVWKVRSRKLRVLHTVVIGLLKRFDGFRVEAISHIQNVDTVAIASAAAGPCGILPKERVIVYYPNLTLVSDVWCAGVRFPASNDMHSTNNDETQFIVDVHFLLTLPGYGLKVLEDDLRDAYPLSKVFGAGFDANVLGVINMTLAYDFLRTKR
eukprot:IDg8039t1